MPSWATILTETQWPNGQLLRVRFLDGPRALHRLVSKYAVLWSEHANITFDFNDATDAEIRISFRYSGSWSRLGTDALNASREEPTMNYGWLTPQSSPDEARAVVLHEFGHALGLIHEHQHPEGGIPWNKEVIYTALKGPPNHWDEATIDLNLFETYNKDQTRYSVVDKESIMMYPIPVEWVTDPRYVVGFNSDLSQKDEEFIAQIYPKES
jgi:hypothetical protein